jgi:hypothetical protein
VSTFDGMVTAALAANPRHDRLEGTLAVAASDGQAHFSDLTLKKPGKSYAITITGGGLTPAISSNLHVIRSADRGGRATVIRREFGRRFIGPRALLGHPPEALHRGATKTAAARGVESPHATT